MGAERWFACELHCHTVHSDGDFTVPALLDAARKRRLEGLALTDHNTTAGCLQARQCRDPVVLGGMEWTTYFGHMPVLDCARYVDWRDARPDTIDEKLRAVRENGGVCGIAHPFQLGTPICTGGHWDYRVRDWSLVDYLEIWSEGVPQQNVPNRRAALLWASLLDRGFRIAPTFGRDWHRLAGNLLPSACTYLRCPAPLTAAGMKQAIKDGRTVVSAGPLFTVEAGAGQTSGDCVKPGDLPVRFRIDLSRVREMDEDRFVPREIRVYTNGLAEALRIPVAGAVHEARLRFEPGGWYVATLWGDTDKTPGTLISVCAPIYSEN